MHALLAARRRRFAAAAAAAAAETRCKAPNSCRQNSQSLRCTLHRKLPLEVAACSCVTPCTPHAAGPTTRRKNRPPTDRLEELPLEVAARAARVAGLHVVWVQREDAAEVADRVVEGPQLLIDRAAVVQRVDAARLEAQHGVVVGERLGEAACGRGAGGGRVCGCAGCVRLACDCACCAGSGRVRLLRLRHLCRKLLAGCWGPAAGGGRERAAAEQPLAWRSAGTAAARRELAAARARRATPAPAAGDRPTHPFCCRRTP